MPLNKTPVYRNLGARVTFLYLEYEDLIAVLLIAPVSFGMPMKLVLQWEIPAAAVLLLLTFKYGKPRGYLGDWWRHLKFEASPSARTILADVDSYSQPSRDQYVIGGAGPAYLVGSP